MSEIDEIAKELQKELATPIIRVCRNPVCNKEFEAKRPWQDFHNPQCRTDFHNARNYTKKGKILGKIIIRNASRCVRCNAKYLVIDNDIKHCLDCIKELLALFSPSVASKPPKLFKDLKKCNECGMTHTVDTPCPVAIVDISNLAESE